VTDSADGDSGATAGWRAGPRHDPLPSPRRPQLAQRTRQPLPDGGAVPSAVAPAVEGRILTELRRLRAEAAGVDGSLVATSDGLLVAEDLPGLEPAKIAAVVATTLSLAKQAVQLTGRGQISEAVVRGSTGNLVVFAIGQGAVLGVLGSKDLNVAMLHFQTRAFVKRIEGAAPAFRRFQGTA
jgi:uncharacterized protein